MQPQVQMHAPSQGYGMDPRSTTVRVQPVTAGVPIVQPMGQAGPMMLFSPAIMAVTKDLKRPTLDPDRGNDFITEFQLYLESLESGQPGLDDQTKLRLLELSLPRGGQSELQRRREEHQRGTGPPVRWLDTWNWVSRTYGRDTQVTTFQELRQLKPFHQGKLTMEALLT